MTWHACSPNINVPIQSLPKTFRNCSRGLAEYGKLTLITFHNQYERAHREPPMLIYKPLLRILNEISGIFVKDDILFLLLNYKQCTNTRKSCSP